ncbi:acyl carrier protein [Sphingosinithalassobacter sp. CS137]|uniref:acyl carrier protein n=1 Tax=Sphingosinithalassobacter sp. CS137 TaxID=2762748 RepID=UPI00165D4AAC|nr:acyl carrier protein [Sphingosinithalassobacter sp. CS137]
MSIIEQDIRDLLAERSGVARDRIRGDSRLLQDLGLHGDAAVGFFTAVAARHQVELTALWKRWDRHFGPERLPLVAWLAFLPAAVGGALAGDWLGETLYLTRDGTRVLAIGLAIGAVWLIARLAPRRGQAPIRVDEVVAAARRGRW